MNTKPLPIIIMTFVVLLLFIAPGKILAATQAKPVTLLPSKGQEIGFVYEAFLNPHQEPGEEEDTPRITPKEFLSTAPSVPRNKRTSRGHGMLLITNDLSKAYVNVKSENVNPEDIVMFHIHCGRPDELGPILIDFANSSNIQEKFADGIFEVELRNEDIEKVSNSGHGIVGAFTAGCPIVPGIPGKDNVKTIAGMQYIAQKGELYFNLHTKAQTFYGDIRGKLRPVM
ncbi:MAG: CHRD domain-containing protein [Scytonema sp. PMC 1069.18]|nr:CHRD domain-containing protein [Scytonema sp. PMC 1069.18]MEC4886354.1 CHRD domain-containing protein [Scytonema sp. PMC 1070.18]